MGGQQRSGGRGSRWRALLLVSLAQATAAAAIPSAAVAQTEAEVRTYQHRLQQLFQRLDQDGDQRLERDEVKGQPYLERHFERLDGQKRGYLSPADLRPTGSDTGSSGGRERARRFFIRADRNSDGQLDRLEAEAYPWLLRRFDEADRNGDGKLSREELRQLRRGGSTSPPQPR